MGGRSPHVSVVLPVHNEADHIEQTLASIRSQEYDGSIEIIVADGMSTDGTREILAAEGVRIVDNPTGRTPAGLNAAIRAGHGEVIVRCDGHALLPAGYVQRAVELLETTGAVNVGGMQEAVGKTFLQRAIAYAMSSRVGIGDSRFHYGGAAGPTDTVYLGVFRRAAIEAVGLYDESLVRNQDYELNIRLRGAGGTIYFDPGLRVRYRPRSSLPALWRQFYEYGAWKRRVVRLHPRSLRLRQLVPPAFVIGLAISAMLLVTPRRAAAAVVPAAYGALLVGATLNQAWRRRDPAVLAYPIALVVMHLSWGLGFLIGRSRG